MILGSHCGDITKNTHFRAQAGSWPKELRNCDYLFALRKLACIPRRYTFKAGTFGDRSSLRSCYCTVDLPADWLLHWHLIADVCTGEELLLYIDNELGGRLKVDGKDEKSKSVLSYILYISV